MNSAPVVCLRGGDARDRRRQGRYKALPDTSRPVFGHKAVQPFRPGSIDFPLKKIIKIMIPQYALTKFLERRRVRCLLCSVSMYKYSKRKERFVIIFTEKARSGNAARRRAQSVLRELEEYRRHGVKISLEGEEYRLRTIAGIVAEKGCYMRDYDFSPDGKVRSIEFTEIGKRPRTSPGLRMPGAHLPEKENR